MFTAVCVVLSAIGHVLAACETVAPWTLVAGSAGVFALVVPFAGRERSLPAIAAVLTAGQLGLHSLFGVGQSRLHLAQTADEALIRTAAKLVCGAGAASLSASDARRIVTMAGIAPDAHTGHAHLAEAAATGPEAPSLAMVLGHLLAGIATGLLLRRGDAALLRLTRISADSAHEVAGAARLRALRAAVVLVRALRAGLPGTPERLPRPSAHTAQPPPPAAGEVLQHTVIRRGPPRVFVLSA